MPHPHTRKLACARLLCLVCVLLSVQPQPRQAASVAPPAPITREYIIFQKSGAPSQTGAASTRLATPAEAHQLALTRTSATAPLPAVALARTAVPTDGFSLVLRGTTQLARYPQAQAAYQRALARWAELFAPDPVQIAEIALNVDFGPQLFGQPFPAPDVLGVTLISEEPQNYDRLLTALRQNSFAPESTRLFAALPNTQVPTEAGAAQSVALPIARAEALGLIESRARRPAIGFNANAPFDFDPRDGIAPGQLDFEAAVLRELGRVLGFSSRVENADANWNGETALSLWDLYRFRPQFAVMQAAETLAQAQRVSFAGGEQVFFTGEDAVPLSTGRDDGQAGDGNLAGHWKDDALTGQYLGVMDPTLAPGERGGFTAQDLRAVRALGYQLQLNLPVLEVLSADDGSRETALPLRGSLLVNRLTPARYPATVDAVRAQLPDNPNGATATGQPLRVVLFADATSSGKPPANPVLLYDRTFTLGALSAHRMLEILLNKPVTLAAGELYVGVQSDSDQVLIGVDRNGAARGRAFVSTDNGAQFQPLLLAQQPANLMLRAVCQENFTTTPTPQLTALSPSAVPPGSAPIELLVYGQHFAAKPDGGFNALSVVRWNGAPRPTEYLSGMLLRTTLTQADLAQAGSGHVTVFTPTDKGGYESAPLEFKLTAQPPTPSLLQMTPDFVTPGAEVKPLTLIGRDFTPTSIAHWNGQPRATSFKSSTELLVALNANDFASAAQTEVTVFTPNPGSAIEGQTSNVLRFRVAPCSYRVLAPSRSLPSSGTGFGAFTLETDAGCPWALTTETPWLRPRGAATGQGRALVGFTASVNTDGPLRRGEFKIAGQTVTVQQLARVTGGSAANYTRDVPLGGIGSLFSAGVNGGPATAASEALPTLLAGTEVRLTDYLGNVFAAPLFYVGPGQLNLLMPAGLQLQNNEFVPGGSAIANIFHHGQLVADGFVGLAVVSPGFFTSNMGGQGVGVGFALRIRADGTQSYEPLGVYDATLKRTVTLPIDLGPETDQIYLVLYGTGFRGRASLANVQAFINTTALPVLYAGPQGELAGLDQVNLLLPRRLAGAGEVRVRVSVNEVGANIPLVAIKGGQ